MLNTLENLMPSRHLQSLDQIFIYRNKTLAHQQSINDELKEQLRFLPSLDEMERINNWASNFCRLVAHAMTNTTFLPHAVSARMAALNVVAKVLGKNFDTAQGGAAYQEREAFYKKT